MIGTNEMSSTSMDISESFRPEELSKADFFDFVTAPDMGIGIGVGVGVGVGMVGIHNIQHNTTTTTTSNNLHHNSSHNRTPNITLNHDSRAAVAGGSICGAGETTPSSNGNNNNNNNNNNNSNNNNNETGNSNNNSSNNNHQNCSNAAGTSNVSSNNNNSLHSNSNNSSNNTGANSTNNNNGSNSGDPTLQGYEFWHTDKDQSRLESTIFEDLDRFCWQQQQQSASQQQQIQTSSTSSHPAHLNSTSPNLQQQHNNVVTPSNSANTSTSSTTGSISQPSSASSIDNTDGQIYTLTVLNGNDSWLKREPESQLTGALDLDSLLGNFSGYIKSEYPYDESGFGNSANKEVNRGDPNGLNMPQVLPQQSISANVLSGQNLPPLITALTGAGSVANSSEVCTSSALHLGQQLAQFQNNNNDWHMADHNAEQNSAESLLRSALQGKGYSKGLHLQNGIALLPSSPSVKDDEMRRILFPTEAGTLAFADSSLNTAPMFEDTQTTTHNSHISNGGNLNNATANPGDMMVDDMFLSLENVFNDDFEKIKRIANEVQQYCNAPPDYSPTPNDVMMQIAPTTTTATSAVTSGNNQISVQLQQTHATTLPTVNATSINLQSRVQQQLKTEAVVSTSTALTTTPNRLNTPKINKKYKRSTVTATATASNNNNNPNAINNNNNSSLNGNTGAAHKTPGASISSGGSSSSNSSNSPTHCNGQRKERSLHYCSICSKGFKDKYSVNVHIRTHTGEKPFACSLCGKSFRQKAHLAKHYQTHMAQKNNGNLVKGTGGNGAKHQRHQHAGNGTANLAATPTHRTMVNTATVSSTMSSVNTGTTSLAVGVPPLNGGLSAPPRTVLPPANGLLANR